MILKSLPFINNIYIQHVSSKADSQNKTDILIVGKFDLSEGIIKTQFVA